MKTIKEVKVELKQLAKEIREMKNTRKSVLHGYVPGLEAKREGYRYLHIAYCLKRGTPLEVIEHQMPDSQIMYFVELRLKNIIAPERSWNGGIEDVKDVCNCEG